MMRVLFLFNKITIVLNFNKFKVLLKIVLFSKTILKFDIIKALKCESRGVARIFSMERD